MHERLMTPDQGVATAHRSVAVAEWREHWPLVISAMFGLSFAAVAVYSMGLFMEPLSQEFGWTRAQITSGLSIFALFAVPLAPVAGALIDRFGSRRLALPGMILTGLAFASFSLATGSMTQWLVLWTMYSFVALAIKTTVWTAAVAAVFTTSRGLALAVTLCGTAIAQTVAPVLAQWLIDSYGWRSAYFWMGTGWAGFAFLLLFLFFFDARNRLQRTAIQGRNPAPQPSPQGLTLGQALRNTALLRIAAAVLVITLLGVAVTVHKVPILTEMGISRETAAQMAATAGVAGIFGKLMTGWMLDRSSNSLIGGISLAIPAIAFVLLLEWVRTPALVLFSMVILGYASGATLQVCTYLTSRYAGLAHFGKIFGFMASLMALGTGLGPVIAGHIFDVFGSYSPLLVAGIPAALICGLLVMGLGPYPLWDAENADDRPHPSAT